MFHGLSALWEFIDNRLHKMFAGVPLREQLCIGAAGLLILKHMHDLSDEVLCARWLENPYTSFSAAN